MKKFALFISFLLCFQTFAQTADEIITQHLEQSGGIKNWKNLNSVILYGDALLSLEESFPIIIYHKRPYQKKVIFLVEGKELLNEGYDGKNGWTYNPISGKNEIVQNYEADSFDSDILDYKNKGFEAVYVGISDSENQACYKVVLTKNVNKISYCFSTKDYSLLWDENDKERMYYYDYKKFNDLQFATRIIAHPKEGGEYVLKFNSIRINPVIDDKLFKF
ncbi:MAG: hypothetical protein PHC38_10845 [Weeksellaceae bacterium]|nr:hypothetical protein [Weeksellaceae bacterium]